MMTRRWLSSWVAMPVLLAGACGIAWADAPGLDKGIAALKAGNAQQAVKLLTDAINAPSATAQDRSRMLYYRAKANLALRQSGPAMADAGAAIYLKGLSPAEAADAEGIKSQAMASVGVSAGAGDAPMRPVVLNPVEVPAKSAVAGPGVPMSAAPVVASVPVKPVSAWPAAEVAPAVVSKPVAVAPVPVAAAAPVPVAAAAPVPVVAAAPWSAAAVRREELPQAIVPKEVAAPVVTQAALPWAAPRVPAPIETGSINRATVAPSAVPTPVGPVVKAAVNAPAVPVVKADEKPGDGAAAPAGGGVLPGLGGIGSMFQSPPSPVQAEVDQANERQRAYAEKIRQHNREIAKRNAGWSVGQTVADEGK